MHVYPTSDIKCTKEQSSVVCGATVVAATALRDRCVGPLTLTLTLREREREGEILGEGTEKEGK